MYSGGGRLFDRAFFHLVSVMLTGPSSPIQHRSPAAHLFFARSDPPPTRSFTRALRSSTNNDFLQKPPKPVDSGNVGAPRVPTFSMVPNVRTSSKGKERDVFDSLESPSFGESLPLAPRVIARARLPTFTDVL
jgi:hypothetical protein